MRQKEKMAKSDWWCYKWMKWRERIKRVCWEWRQPSYSSTCGGTDWTCRRAFWLPWRPSVSWQMAASKCRTGPSIACTDWKFTHTEHPWRPQAPTGGLWREWEIGGHGCFDHGSVRHLVCCCSCRRWLDLQNKHSQSGSYPLRQTGWIHGGYNEVSKHETA